MRIATWNVNSLKARLEKVEWWLERAAPDVLLIQETKLADDDAPVMAFAMAGYELIHHGEGRWNGVAIAVRQGLGADDVVTNFGDGPVRDSGPGAAVAVSEEDFNPFDEARMVAARVDPAGTAGGPIRVVSLYAPNGRVVGSPFYDGKLRWFERLERWLRETQRPDDAARPRRRLQPRPDRRRRVGSRRPSTAAPTSRSPSASGSGRSSTGASSTPTAGPGRSPAGSRGGTTGPATSTRTSGCGSTTCCVTRPWPSGWSGPRSTARPARARRSRPTTRRSSSTSTRPAGRSTPAGPAPCPRIAARSRPARR